MKTFFSKHLLQSAALLAPLAALAMEAEQMPATVVDAVREKPAFVALDPDDPADSPGATNLIDAADYQKGRASTLADMLQSQPGVFIRSRAGQEEARISIRGSGIQRNFHGRGILLTQDGMPLNLADGSFDMQGVDPAAYSRITVWRGAASLSRGAGNAGGVIDLATLTGADAPAAKLSAEAGAFGYAKFSSALSTTDKYPDYGDATVTATATHADGWRDASEADSQRVNASIGAPLGERAENRIYLGYVNAAAAIPGALTKARLENDPRQAAPGVIANPNSRNYEWFRLADRIVANFDDANASLSAGWQHKHLDHPIFQTLDKLGDDFFAQARIDFTGDLDGCKNRLSLGVTPTFGDDRERRFVNPPGDAERGALLSEIRSAASNIALFAVEDHHFVKNIAGVAGIRADWARRDYEVLIPGGGPTLADSREKDFFGVSPMLGARYEFEGSDRRIFANISRSFEAPTFGDFGQSRASVPNGVDAQTATTLEIGTRGSAGPVAWDIAYYHALLSDEFISSTDFSGGPVATFNAGTTRHQGVEAGLDINLFGGDIGDANAQKLLLRQVFGLNDFRFKGDPVYGNNRIAGIPELTWRGELMYEHPCGFYAGPNLECAGRAFVDHANTLSADAYAVLGFRAGLKSPTGWNAFLDLRNLTGAKYAATTGVVNRINAANAAQFHPGDGFGAYAGVSHAW